MRSPAFRRAGGGERVTNVRSGHACVTLTTVCVADVTNVCAARECVTFAPSNRGRYWTCSFNAGFASLRRAFSAAA